MIDVTGPVTTDEPWDYTHIDPETVTRIAQAALTQVESRLAGLGTHPAAFTQTVGLLDQIDAALMTAYGRSAFLAQVHPDRAVRDAAQAAEQQMSTWRALLPARPQVVAAVTGYAATAEAGALTGEPARLVAHWVRDVQRAGAGLPEPGRSELDQARARLVELASAFARSLAELDDGVDLTPDELAGLSDDDMARLGAGAAPGTLRVTLDAPVVSAVLSQVHDRTLREAVFRKSWSKAVSDNRPRLQEALALRGRAAALLGHRSWADYVLDVRMAGTPARVAALETELADALTPVAARERAELTAMLVADGYDGPLTWWDFDYYDRRLQLTRFGVDQQQVSQYLPLAAVLEGMLDLTGEVFGLTYRQVPDAHAWHPDVRLLEIHDRPTGELVAHVYLDLFPREGKYAHAAAFPLQVGHRRPDGTYQTPVTAIVANLTPPAADRPSLLTHGPHGQVETLFHEFGHVLHMSLTRAQFARFSGAATEWDFVEAPSQIMEHWVWRPEVLARISAHPVTGEPMPADLAAALVASRYVDVGLRGLRQVFYGTLDQALHARPDPPTGPTLDDVLVRTHAVTGMPYPTGTFFPSGFGHLMGGYDAGYYGYLWAEVIGDDLLSRFQAEGMLSPQVGAAWRHDVLEPNGTRDAADLVEAFLGRPPTIDAYLRLRGLDSSLQAGPRIGMWTTRR